VIAAALIARVQIDAARRGKPSAIDVAVSSVAVLAQSATTATTGALRAAGAAVVTLPRLEVENKQLRAQTRALKRENARLAEALAQTPEGVALARAAARTPAGISATTVGYDPENIARTVTIDRGTRSGVRLEAGVVTDDGVVGRVLAVTPFASTVQLLTDATSKIPAVVQRGRWWGIATGVPQSDAVALQYVSQDARLRAGDLVVTGEGRSFHAGLPIGRIAKIFHPEGALYQTAMLTPAVRFGRLSGVLVLPRPVRASR
jgi:rod shape-determining protein MreC